MRVVVQGAGGVGLGLGSFLLAAGEAVAFVGRDATVAALRRDGLTRGGRFGAHRAPPGSFAAVEALDALAGGAFEAPDFVLACVKSFDSERAAAALAAATHVLGEHADVVVCQNGWGGADAFARALGPARVYGARVITGFACPTLSRVEVTAHAEPVAVGCLFGAPPAAAEPLCAALRRGGLPAETTERLGELLVEKLLYNGCLNALGAICGVPYGALGASAPARAVMRELAEEAYRALDAAGLRARWPTADGFLKALYEELLPPTAAHEPSTLQDLRAGRRTEIDALNGAVVRLAEAHGLDAPVNRTLCELVHLFEEKSGAR
jgi:2-dehydropantoate 2-reductase